MGIKDFFEVVESEAATMATAMLERGLRPVQVLERALARAMVDRSHPHGPTCRLRRGQGAKARARILVAAARFGLTDATMLPGERVGEWLARGLRELAADQLLPLIRAAARERLPQLADLEVQAP